MHKLTADTVLMSDHARKLCNRYIKQHDAVSRASQPLSSRLQSKWSLPATAGAPLCD